MIVHECYRCGVELEWHKLREGECCACEDLALKEDDDDL